MNRKALSGLVLACVALLGGCARVRQIVPVEGPVLGPAYATQVDVVNWRGPVEITANPNAKAPYVKVRNEKLGKGPKRKELAATTTATAVSSFEGGRPVLRVVTRPASEPPANVATRLTIVVPQIGGATVRNTDGTIELTGGSGPVVIDNTGAGGDVTVRTAAAMTESVNVRTSAGRVLYQVGPGSTGKFELTSDSGQAKFDSQVGVVRQAKSEPGHYRGQLDGESSTAIGVNPVMLHSGAGDVMARVIPNAMTFTERWDGGWPTSPTWLARLGGK